MSDVPACPHHPTILLPSNLTCPLCAQERRRKAYAMQRAEGSQTVCWAVQELLRPATDTPGETS